MALSSDLGGFFTVSGSAGSSLVLDLSQTEFFLEPEPHLVAEGALRRSLAVELDSNALVDKFEIVVTAKPAIATLAAEVAQVRISGALDLIIDFGAPRTVAMVRPGGGFDLDQVMSWNGMAFAIDVPFHTSLFGSTGILDETRTERLLLKLSGNGDKAALIAETLLVLPDAPSDLELRIDDGPPVWRNSGAVRLEPGTDLSPDGFNQNGERLVDLTAALAALTGNPVAPEAKTFRLELTSRTAGRLDLAAPPERRSLRHVWRAGAANDNAPRLAFAEEGAQALPLTASGMPGDAALGEIRVTVKGVAPPERVQPPVGPDPSDLVEIVLDANRAALVRLDVDPRIASLSGLRLPLTVGPGGAQATVALWSSTAAGEPDAPVASAVSKPVPLDEGAERWVSFAFNPPVIPVGAPLWAAVLIGRGQAIWRPTLAAAVADEAGSLRIGPAAGPWYPLPALFDRRSGNEFGLLRGRLRSMGLPGKATPIAPVRLDAGLAPVEITPSDAGVRVSVPATQAARALTVTTLTAMTVTFADIDLVTTG